MLVHIVTFTLKNHPAAGELEDLGNALGVLATGISEIRNLRHGQDLGEQSTNAHYALVAEFDNAEDFNRYLNHPAHLAVVNDVVIPLCEHWSAAQFTV